MVQEAVEQRRNRGCVPQELAPVVQSIARHACGAEGFLAGPKLLRVHLLSSPARQQRWRELVRQVYRLDAIDPGPRANRLLEVLSGRLLVEGERVVRSNERMAATIRRALESAATGEDRRLRELVREIQQLALACRHSPPPETTSSSCLGRPTSSRASAASSGNPTSLGA